MRSENEDSGSQNSVCSELTNPELSTIEPELQIPIQILIHVRLRIRNGLEPSTEALLRLAHYSYLRATAGSTRMARLAGR